MKASTNQSGWQGIDAWSANVILLLNLGKKKKGICMRKKKAKGVLFKQVLLVKLVNQVQWDNQMAVCSGKNISEEKNKLQKAVWMDQILHSIRELRLIFLDLLLHADTACWSIICHDIHNYSPTVKRYECMYIEIKSATGCITFPQNSYGEVITTTTTATPTPQYHWRYH